MTKPVMHECANCGVRFWITARLDACRRSDGGSFYCPNGHCLSFGKSEAEKAREELDKVRRERDRLKQNEAFYEDVHRQQGEEIRQLKASRGKVRAELTRVRKRVGHGVCPCCNRTFANLQRHMASRHAGYAEVEEAAAA